MVVKHPDYTRQPPALQNGKGEGRCTRVRLELRVEDSVYQDACCFLLLFPDGSGIGSQCSGVGSLCSASTLRLRLRVID